MAFGKKKVLVEPVRADVLKADVGFSPPRPPDPDDGDVTLGSVSLGSGVVEEVGCVGMAKVFMTQYRGTFTGKDFAGCSQSDAVAHLSDLLWAILCEVSKK